MTRLPAREQPKLGYTNKQGWFGWASRGGNVGQSLNLHTHFNRKPRQTPPSRTTKARSASRHSSFVSFHSSDVQHAVTCYQKH
eukprot:2948741-Amphidinium_carterae.1